MRWDGRLREPRAGQPGHVAFREGFLEEAISKMNPDRRARSRQGKRGGKGIPGRSTRERGHRGVESGGCRELAVIWEQGLESKLRADLRGPCVSRRELGLCSVAVLPHP